MCCGPAGRGIGGDEVRSEFDFLDSLNTCPSEPVAQVGRLEVVTERWSAIMTIYRACVDNDGLFSLQ